MKSQKLLSILLAAMMLVSVAAFAAAESTGSTTEDTAIADGEDVTADAPLSLNDMLTQAMADAYYRQAAYAAFAEAFPDSRSIASVDMHTQIVLLEMLLKANGVALPADASSVAVPETVAEAYQALAAAETNAVTTLRSYLSQESLPDDARIIFRSVLQPARENATVFARKVKNAQWAQQLEAILSGNEGDVYVMNGSNRHGQWTLYFYSNSQNASTTDEATGTTDDVTETTDNSGGDSTGN